MSAPMVRAILDGSKTQTRRIVKSDRLILEKEAKAMPCSHTFWKGGSVGDRLWVREAYYQVGHWEKVAGVRTKKGRQKWQFVGMADVVFEPPAEFRKGRHHKDPQTKAWHKRLGRFMPRKASRIMLEIVGVQVERLQEINDDDAMDEGADVWFNLTNPDHPEPPSSCFAFKLLWETINGAGSWLKNPWVQVVTFKKL